MPEPIDKNELPHNKQIDLGEIDSIIEGEISPTPMSAPQSTSNEDLSGEEKFRLNQLKKMDKENQLKFLINISFQKGLSEGIKLAKALNNPYLIDEFHDKLTDEFYEKLVEKGLLKKL